MSRAGLRVALGIALAALVGACEAPTVAPDNLPRFVTPREAAPRVALVLGSGGPRGFAFVGVIKVLEEIGVKPDLIVGTSVGAMVGSLYASGLDAAALEKLVYDMNMLEFFEMKWITGGVASGGAVQSFVTTQLRGRPIEKLPIPLAVVATRLKDRQLVVFNAGDTGLAVRASSADPESYEPVRVGSELYVDGDLLSPVPIRAARRLGAQMVIAVDVSAFLDDTPQDAPREWFEKDKRRTLQVAAEVPEANVYLHPNIGYYAGSNEAYRRRVIAAAEAYTRSKIPEIRAALARAGVTTTAQSTETARMPAGEASR